MAVMERVSTVPRRIVPNSRLDRIEIAVLIPCYNEEAAIGDVPVSREVAEQYDRAA